MNTECDFTSDEIQEFLDGALAPERARALALHRMDCRRCAERLAGLETVDAVLRNLETLSVPADLHAAILSATPARPSPRTRLAAVAALVLVSALAVGWLFGPGLDTGPLSDARAGVSEALGDIVGPIVSTDRMGEAVSGMMSSLRNGDVDLPLSGWPLLALFLASLAAAAGCNVAAFRRLRRESL